MKMPVTLCCCTRQLLARLWDRKHSPHLGKAAATLASIRALETGLWENDVVNREKEKTLEINKAHSRREQTTQPGPVRGPGKEMRGPQGAARGEDVPDARHYLRRVSRTTSFRIPGPLGLQPPHLYLFGLLQK